MTIGNIDPAGHRRIVHLPRAARRLFAVVSRRVSFAAERLAASAGETSTEYYRFPWF